MLPLHYLLFFLYFNRTRKPFNMILFREIFLIDMLLIFSSLFIFFDSFEIEEDSKKLDHTTIE